MPRPGQINEPTPATVSRPSMVHHAFHTGHNPLALTSPFLCKTLDFAGPPGLFALEEDNHILWCSNRTQTMNILFALVSSVVFVYNLLF